MGETAAVGAEATVGGAAAAGGKTVAVGGETAAVGGAPLPHEAPPPGWAWPIEGSWIEVALPNSNP
jgi:hypothetical protein